MHKKRKRLRSRRTAYRCSSKVACESFKTLDRANVLETINHISGALPGVCGRIDKKNRVVFTSYSSPRTAKCQIEKASVLFYEHLTFLKEEKGKIIHELFMRSGL